MAAPETSLSLFFLFPSPPSGIMEVGLDGNLFDVRMSEEPDGTAAAEKVVWYLKQKGMVLVEANAPHELLTAAFEECQNLAELGEFKAPLTVFNMQGIQEAQWMHDCLSGEKSIWLKKDKTDGETEKTALRILDENITNFGLGLLPILKNELGIEIDRNSLGMVHYYGGDQSYDLHVDNPHLCKRTPDSGLRLTAAYYINPHWDPYAGDNGGGLHLYLTDPRSAPEHASEARKATKLVIAPHADTLVMWLSDKMAHEVIPTKGDDKWFCISKWFIDGTEQEKNRQREAAELRKAKHDAGDSDSDPGVD